VTTTTSAPTTTTTLPTTTTTAPEPFVYRVGLSEPPTTNNFWAYYDPQSSLVDQYILDPTKPTLYTYDYPDLNLAADVAQPGDVPEPTQDGDEWVVEVPLREDARWSDGVPMTADDVVFTFETARELGLQRGWLSAYPLAGGDSLGLVSVEAQDANTVVFRFNGEPGLPFWPNGPGTAPIMPRHFWEPIVDEASSSNDPLTALVTADASGEPSGGPFVITRFGSVAVEAEPNPNYQRRGETSSSGAEIGPFFDAVTFSIYDSPQEAAVALDEGEIDVILAPGGLDNRVAAFLDTNTDIEVVTNDTNGFRYLGFNLRTAPMSSPAFREAVALMIDRELLASSVLGGQAVPMYATVPRSNTRWFDPDAAATFADRYSGLTQETRLSRAVDVLSQAGFTWEQNPAYVDNAVVAGSGVTFEGEPVPPVRILAPGSQADPLRATTALWIEEWLSQLGFETEVTLTDFTGLVNRVFTPTPASTLDVDLFVLGWRLPAPAVPVYHESFWATRNDTLATGGNNATGFSNSEFDALVDEYNATRTEEDARDILWQMERIIFDERPYIILFDAPISEAYRKDTVRYPFTETISGLQYVNGLPALVQPNR